jgi:NADH dehydrogenase (ubiquinone) 1 alpha subcomplex subunit 13
LPLGRERRAFKQEKWFIRSTLMPLLQAEEDVAFLERQAKKRAEEARIMKDVPGWEVGKSVYHTKRWILPPLNDMNYPGRWGPAE